MEQRYIVSNIGWPSTALGDWIVTCLYIPKYISLEMIGVINGSHLLSNDVWMLFTYVIVYGVSGFKAGVC